MRWTLQVVTAPVYEPCSLAEAKRWAREDTTDHDQVLTLLIKAMRRYAENRTGRAFITRTLRLLIEDWPRDPYYGARILLPYPPLQGVSSFQYRDTDGVLTTLATDQYDVHTAHEPGFIIPAYNVSWPTIRRRPDSLQFTYTAGYAPGSPSDEFANQEVIPETLRVWMEARMLTLFDKRDHLIVNGQVMPLPYEFVDGLLDDLVLGTRLF